MISIDKNKIQKLCSTHKVDKLYLFGSATNESFSPDSDVDLLVRFKEIDLKQYFTNYIGLKTKLKELFNRDVDLLEEQTLKNPVLIRSINRNKELIYG